MPTGASAKAVNPLPWYIWAEVMHIRVQPSIQLSLTIFALATILPATAAAQLGWTGPSFSGASGDGRLCIQTQTKDGAKVLVALAHRGPGWPARPSLPAR